MSNTVCGREYTTHKCVDPWPPRSFQMVPTMVSDGEGGQKKKMLQKERKGHYRKPGTRFIVEGIMHSGGEKPIRFKSLQKAENYLKNFGLEK